MLGSVQLQSNAGFDYAGFFATWIWPLLMAIVGGIISGIIVVITVNHLQRPSLVVSIADNKYDGQAPAHYVHLQVENIKTTWHGLVGGTAAVKCKCTLTLEDGRRFVTKWASREPWGTEIAIDPSGKVVLPVRVLDQKHIDQAKLEVLDVGEQKRVDVAVRLNGDSSCYIHTPENFLDPNYRPKTHEVLPGIHRVTAVIEHDGDRGHIFQFTIVNEAGDRPGLLALRAS